MSGVSRVGRIVALGAVVALCAATVAVAAGWSLRSGLLRSGEMPGFRVVQSSIRAQHTAAGFARVISLTAPEERAYRRFLTKLRFVSSAEEHLRGPHHRRALSIVAEFGSPRGARRMARSLYDLGLGAGRYARTFSLPGIAASFGAAIRVKPVAIALVYWVEGDCTFGMAQYLPHGSGLTARQVASRVITGAEALYARTNGTCPARAATFTG